jgi:prepilin-type N-terminal cleavage/methylation domain-containing protein
MPVRSSYQKGFSLIEIVVGTAVFLIFAVGIYSGAQFVFKVVYQSRLRILETAMLNEQIELIRNIPFHDVGIESGSPSGVLSRNVVLTRNNIDFLVTRTIRNIDDPFDGTIGGTPNDTAPADYKLVELSIQCVDCGQRQPLTMTSRVAPKYLEGDPDNGALFVEVFDANAVPVQGASVHIVATTTSSTVDFVDTTDNNGRLAVVDLSEGVGAYQITVSKSGYTTDQTYPTSISIPNPTKPLASVIAQDVSSVSFSIDRVSTINTTALDATCAPISGVSITAQGTRLIGTDPDTLLFNQTGTTNGSGELTFSSVPWDIYAFRMSGYDLIGSIPSLPVLVPPDNTQPVSLLLGPDTPHSLLIHVADSVTGQPLSSSTVRVYATSTPYDTTKVTGVGHIRQTDWSGGTGQESFSNESRYYSDDGQLDGTSTPGDVRLQAVGGDYVYSGWLESSTIDLGLAANYFNIYWEPFTQPTETGAGSLKFQLSTSNSSTPGSWNFIGPDGTNTSFYDTSDTAIADIHDGDQYIRYRAYFQTATTTATPLLSEVLIPYTNSCTPPGQVYFGGVSEQTYIVEVTRSGYEVATEQVDVSGDIIFSIDLIAE